MFYVEHRRHTTTPNMSGSNPVWGVLIPLDKSLSGKLDLTQSNYTFGTGENCDYQIFYQHDQQPDCIESYSEQHFRLEKDDIASETLYYIHDLSDHGTYVNGKKIGKNKKRPVDPNAEISLVTNDNKVFIFIVETPEDLVGIPQEIRQSYIISKTLGKGAFGKVRLLFTQDGSAKVAMKCVEKSIFNGPSDREVLQETEIMVKLKHPCIIEIIETHNTTLCLFIIMELAEAGTLQTRLRQYGKLEEKTTKIIIHQILLAVEYLHNKGITHRDIKPDNILLQSRSHETLIKVTDFGVSKAVNAATLMGTLAGTPCYIAPEIWKNEILRGKYSNAVDVWSIGIILYQCLIGDLPIKIFGRGEFRHDLMETYTIQQKFDNYIWAKMPEAEDLGRNLLKVEPRERILVGVALKHSWFQYESTRRIVEELTGRALGDSGILSAMSSTSERRSSITKEEEIEEAARQEFPSQYDNYLPGQQNQDFPHLKELHPVDLRQHTPQGFLFKVQHQDIPQDPDYSPDPIRYPHNPRPAEIPGRHYAPEPQKFHLPERNYSPDRMRVQEHERQPERPYSPVRQNRMPVQPPKRFAPAQIYVESPQPEPQQQPAAEALYVSPDEIAVVKIGGEEPENHKPKQPAVPQQDAGQHTLVFDKKASPISESNSDPTDTVMHRPRLNDGQKAYGAEQHQKYQEKYQDMQAELAANKRFHSHEQINIPEGPVLSPRPYIQARRGNVKAGNFSKSPYRGQIAPRRPLDKINARAQSPLELSTPPRSPEDEEPNIRGPISPKPEIPPRPNKENQSPFKPTEVHQPQPMYQPFESPRGAVGGEDLNLQAKHDKLKRDVAEIHAHQNQQQQQPANGHNWQYPPQNHYNRNDQNPLYPNIQQQGAIPQEYRYNEHPRSNEYHLDQQRENYVVNSEDIKIVQAVVPTYAADVVERILKMHLGDKDATVNSLLHMLNNP